MSGVFNLIDREKFLAGEADYDAGEVIAPPGVEPIPIGLSYDAQVGRHLVRFLFAFTPDGTPRGAAFWTPERPKRLKPAHIKKYRRERRNFFTQVAKQFSVPIQTIDRIDGAPKVTERIYEDGAVEMLDPPCPYVDGRH